MQQLSTLTYRKKQIYFLVIVNTKMHPDWRHADYDNDDNDNDKQFIFRHVCP